MFLTTNEEAIKFEGNKQFLKLQKYLLKLGKRFPSGRIYKSLNEFKIKNGLINRGDEGFFVIDRDDITCEFCKDKDIIREHYITYKDIFFMALDIE